LRNTTNKRRIGTWVLSHRCGLEVRLVFGVGDVVAPGGWALGDGDVTHEAVVGGAVPVLVAVRCVVNVTRAELEHWFAA
jgi:hypothetical protein